jgi:hypothetical protein
LSPAPPTTLAHNRANTRVRNFTRAGLGRRFYLSIPKGAHHLTTQSPCALPHCWRSQWLTLFFLADGRTTQGARTRCPDSPTQHRASTKSCAWYLPPASPLARAPPAGPGRRLSWRAAHPPAPLCRQELFVDGNPVEHTLGEYAPLAVASRTQLPSLARCTV